MRVNVNLPMKDSLPSQPFPLAALPHTPGAHLWVLETKPSASPTRIQGFETGLNGGYYDVGIHRVSVVVAKTIVVIRNLFSVPGDYFPHSLVPRNHEPQ